VSAIGGLIVVAPALRRSSESVPWKVLGAFIVSGLFFGIPNLRWLFLDGGIHAWTLQTSYGTSVFFVKYPFEYLAGAAPIQFLLADIAPFSAAKHLFWNGIWSDVAIVVAAVATLFATAGAVFLVCQRRMVQALCLTLPFAYGTFAVLVNKGGFGSFQTVAYLTPLACVLAACGVHNATSWFSAPVAAARHIRSVRWGGPAIPTVALAAAVCSIVGFQLSATAVDEAFFVGQHGMLSPENLKLSVISSVVPRGSTVLMYTSDGSNGFASVSKTQALVAAASFLPGRNLTIDGKFFTGTFDRSDRSSVEAALPRQYEYILHYADRSISDPAVPPTYHVVWQFPADHLVLYKRNAR
jgi:hypothetical protein